MPTVTFWEHLPVSAYRSWQANTFTERARDLIDTLVDAPGHAVDLAGDAAGDAGTPAAEPGAAAVHDGAAGAATAAGRGDGGGTGWAAPVTLLQCCPPVNYTGTM
jgi:hypothetical protein